MSGNFEFELPDGRVILVEGAPSPEAAKEYMDRQWPTLRRQTPIRGFGASANEQFWGQIAGLPGAGEAVAAAVNAPEARDYLRSVGEGVNVPNDPRTRAPELSDLISRQAVDAVKAYAGQAAGSLAGMIPAALGGAAIGAAAGAVGGPIGAAGGAATGARLAVQGQAGLSGVSELYKGLVEEGVDPQTAGIIAIPVGVLISRVENKYLEQALTRSLSGKVSQDTIGRLTQRLIGGRAGGIRQTAIGGAASEAGGEALREATRGIVTGNPNLPERLERIAEAGVVGTIAGAGVGTATRAAGGAGPSAAETQQAEAALAEQATGAPVQPTAAETPAPPVSEAPPPVTQPEVTQASAQETPVTQTAAPETATEAAPSVTTPEAAPVQAAPQAAEPVATEPAAAPTTEAPAPAPAASGFTTAKGSTYEINEQGQTIRTKRSEGAGQGTTYPPHNALYVKPEEASDILEDLRGGAKYRFIINTPEGPRYLGPDDNIQNYDAFIAIVDRSNNIQRIVEGSKEPAVGLSPVELLYAPDAKGEMNANRHIGNPIVELRQAAPAPTQEAAPAQPAPAPAPEVTPEQEQSLWRGYSLNAGPEASNPVVQAARQQTTGQGRPAFTRQQFGEFVRQPPAAEAQAAPPAQPSRQAVEADPAQPRGTEPLPNESQPGEQTRQNPPQEWSAASDNSPEADIDISQTDNAVWSPVLGNLPPDSATARQVLRRANRDSLSTFSRWFLSPILTMSKASPIARPAARVMSYFRRRTNEFNAEVQSGLAKNMSNLSRNDMLALADAREQSALLRAEAPSVAQLSPEAKAAFDSQIAATRRASEYLAESMNIKYFDPAGINDPATKARLVEMWKRHRNKHLWEIPPQELQAASPEGFAAYQEFSNQMNPYYLPMQAEGTHFIAAYKRNADGQKVGRPVKMVSFTPLKPNQKGGRRPDPEAAARQELARRGITSADYYITPQPVEFTRDRDAAAIRDNADVFSDLLSKLANTRSFKNDIEAQNLINSFAQTLDKAAIKRYMKPNDGIMIPFTDITRPYYLTDVVPRYMAALGKLQSRAFTQDSWGRALDGLNKTDRDYFNELRDYSSMPREAGVIARLRSLNFHYFIGAAFDSAMINMTQSYTSTLPMLIRDSGNPAQSTAIVQGAFNDALRHFGSALKLDATRFDEAVVNAGRTADERAALRRAAKIEVFAPIFTTEVGGISDAVSARDFAERGFKNADTLAKRTNYVVNLMGRPQKTAEQINRAAAFLAAYRMAKANPEVIQRANQTDGYNFGGPDAAFEYAVSRTDDTQLITTPEDRAYFMRATPVNELAFQFMSYPFKMTEIMLRHFKDGIKGVATGDPTLAKVGTLGFLMYAAPIVLMAGIWGLPGAELARDALEELIKLVWKDVENFDQDLYQASQSFGGNFFAETVTRGLPHALGAFTGSSRMGLNPFQLQDLLGMNPGMAFGPAASLGSQLVESYKYAQEGDYLPALGSLMPRWVGNIARGMNVGFGTGEIRQPEGRTTINQNQIAEIDKNSEVPTWLRMAIGFPPPDIMDIRTRARYARELTTEARTYSESANRELARYRAEQIRAEQSNNMAAWEASRRRMLEAQEKINARNARLLASGETEGLFQYDWDSINKLARDRAFGTTTEEALLRQAGTGRARAPVERLIEGRP